MSDNDFVTTIKFPRSLISAIDHFTLKATEMTGQVISRNEFLKQACHFYLKKLTEQDTDQAIVNVLKENFTKEKPSE